MAYTLDTNELADVRLQLGARISPAEFTDAHILADSLLGEAVDYVFDRVLDFIDTNGLTQAQTVVVNELLDGTQTDITTFVTACLVARQRTIFRRAVVYRTAGNSVGSAKLLNEQTVIGLTEDYNVETNTDRRETLYTQADAQLDRLKNSFQTDAIQTSRATGSRVARGLKIFAIHTG